MLPKPIKGGDGDEAEAKEYAEAYAEVEKKVKASQVCGLTQRIVMWLGLLGLFLRSGGL